MASWLCFFPCPTCQDLACALPSPSGRGRFAAALNCTGTSGTKVCLSSCAWECVTLLKLRGPSCHHRALAGKHSGVWVCCGALFSYLNTCPPFQVQLCCWDGCVSILFLKRSLGNKRAVAVSPSYMPVCARLMQMCVWVCW